jgi:uncharacterized protein YdhG (YjbR/CyaY superfamily)
MQRTATTFNVYLTEVPAERRDVLSAIRKLCRENLPGYEEGMEYGMPSYARDGVVELGFASQKNDVAIYGLKSDALAAHRSEFTGADVGKECIRYRRPEQVDLAAVERLIRATATSNGRVC